MKKLRGGFIAGITANGSPHNLRPASRLRVQNGKTHLLRQLAQCPVGANERLHQTPLLQVDCDGELNGIESPEARRHTVDIDQSLSVANMARVYRYGLHNLAAQVSAETSAQQTQIVTT